MIHASERLLPGPAAVERVTGDRPSYSTYFRWTQRGIRTPDGQRVRLEFVKAGSRRLTSEEAVRRFFVASTGFASSRGPVSPGEDVESDVIAELQREGL